MSLARHLGHQLHEEEIHLLAGLRKLRPGDRHKPRPPLTLGQHVADKVASIVGSWRFIIIQSILLAIWIALNITAYVEHWDPYPFILLNLALSFQAAYTAPIIMMSQNRQAEIDRQGAEQDYQVNLKAELEIELLHEKVDQLREKEILLLTQTIRDLQSELVRLRAPGTA